MKFIIHLFFLMLFSCNSKNNEAESSTNLQSQIVTLNDSLASCSPRIIKRNEENGLVLLNENQKQELHEKSKKLIPDLPIIGLLMYDDVLTTELTAPMDVFTKLY